MVILAFIRGLKLLPILYKYWWIWLSLFLFLPGFISSVDDGWQQKDFRIPLGYVGNSIISADEGMYDILEEADFEVGKIKSWKDKLNISWNFLYFLVSSLWMQIWMMFFSIYGLYRLIRFVSNDSLRGKAFIFSVSIIGLIQIFFGGFPYRGTYSLIKFIIEVLMQF